MQVDGLWINQFGCADRVNIGNHFIRVIEFISAGTERIQELRYEPLYLDAHSDRPEIGHFDLLHHARRRWKSQLPNCKLQTLERYICGRNRVGDIPGRDIPLAYHDYVRTGNTEQVRSILHHNALDLVTLLQLSLTFIGYEPCSEARVAS